MVQSRDVPDFVFRVPNSGFRLFRPFRSVSCLFAWNPPVHFSSLNRGRKRKNFISLYTFAFGRVVDHWPNVGTQWYQTEFSLTGIQGSDHYQKTCWQLPALQRMLTHQPKGEGDNGFLVLFYNGRKAKTCRIQPSSRMQITGHKSCTCAAELQSCWRTKEQFRSSCQ